MTTPKVEGSRGRFRKGRAKTGGRRRGTPNQADPEHQEALADAIKAHPALLFKAAEHAVGKPHQAVEVNQDLAGGLEIRWKDHLITRLEDGRKRVADPRGGSGAS